MKYIKILNKKGLFSKMVFTYTIIIAISFSILATVLTLWFQNHYFQQNLMQKRDSMVRIGKRLSNMFVEGMYGNVDNYDINRQIKFISDYFDAHIWIVDSDARIINVSNDKDKELIGEKILVEEFKKIQNNKIIQMKNERVKDNGEVNYIFGIPIADNQIFYGAIWMNISIKEIENALENIYKIIWLSAIFAIIISSIVIYYFSQRIIIKPLSKINIAAKKISKGEVDKRVYINSEDEIGELAESFNSMADSIEKVENNRRLFISNVSHEIRSPITSIKGFIGGMLDGIVPQEKEKYYLDITYKEIQRLTRLVNDLLDLSAIESGKFTMNIKRVNLNEIIRLVIIKFETKIKTKNLKVDVHFQNEDSYVFADTDRLIQIVTNTVDNALKYVNDGGNIKVTTKIKGKKVYVSVFNTGKHISEEDLKHIWDRFYKADKARSSKISTGLGLSIVRSLLTQLGEDISVKNQENGVCFTFTLTKS